MRYSLISRFRGAILGAVLGEGFAAGIQKFDEKSLCWSKIAVLGAQSLIDLGKFDLNDWRSRQQIEFPQLETADNISPKAIIATLPVALFFHDNIIKLRQNLLDAVKIWNDDPVVRDGALALGYAIAQSLTNKLNPVTLIPQTISFIGETSTSTPQKLLKVNKLLEEGAGLEKAYAELRRDEKPSSAVAMAFYCFLCTPNDFRLSVLRATHKSINSEDVGALTGALSGTYNSTVGIPVPWQVGLFPAKSRTSRLSSQFQMVKLADALLAVWSGMYDLDPHAGEVKLAEQAIAQSTESLVAIAAPRVIRLR